VAHDELHQIAKQAHVGEVASNYPHGDPVESQQDERTHTQKDATSEAGRGHAHVVGDDVRRHVWAVGPLRPEVLASLLDTGCAGVSPPQHLVGQDLFRQAGAIAQRRVAGHGRDGECQERRQYIGPCLHHGRGRLAHQHLPQAADGMVLVAVKGVVPRAHQPLEPMDRGPIRSVGPGPGEIGRDLTIARCKGRQFFRRQAV
jgi:hypothetical protein